MTFVKECVVFCYRMTMLYSFFGVVTVTVILVAKGRMART